MRFRQLFVIALVTTICQAQELAPTGTLRATFLQNNPVQGRVDAKTGAVSGSAVDLTRELGRQLGVPVSIVGVAGGGGGGSGGGARRDRQRQEPYGGHWVPGF